MKNKYEVHVLRPTENTHMEVSTHERVVIYVGDSRRDALKAILQVEINGNKYNEAYMIVYWGK